MQIRTIGLLRLVTVLVSCAAIGSPAADANGSGDQKFTKVEKLSSKPASGAVQPELSVEVLSKKWKHGIIDTASGAEYLEGKEKEVIIEINMVRTDPVSYVKHYLEPLR